MSTGTVPPAVWPRPAPESTRAASADRPVTDRLLERWTHLVGSAAAAALVALLVSFIVPKQYTSNASFVPEQRSGAKMPAGLGGLIGQVGLFSESGSESPEFYQRLLTSRQLRTTVLTTDYGGQNLIAYYKTHNRRDSLEKAIKKFSKDYSVSVDRATRIVRVDVELKRPELAHAVATRMLAAVDSFNSHIRRTMAGQRRRFVEHQFAAAAARLEDAERALRDFHMRNRSITASPTLRFEETRFERRVQLASELYQTLSQDLQTAQIDEVNDTPVISVIDPPSVPVKHSSPRRLVLALLAAFIGALLAAIWIVWRPRS